MPAVTAVARALINASPEQPTGYFLLAMAAAEAGQVAKAVPLLEAAVERGPEAEHLAQLAKLLILLRRDGEAARAARSAMALTPGDALTLDTIGCVLARLGDHEASVVPFAAAVTTEPDNLEYRYNLAAANGFIGKVDDARAQYEQILSEDPGNARVHYAIAILSRQTAGIRGRTLIVNLPGQPKAIRECLGAVFPAIPYCIDLLVGPYLTTDESKLVAFRPKK